MAQYLSGLVRTFQDAHLRAEMAESQLLEIEQLVAAWFVDSDQGARTFLREIGLHTREREKAALSQADSCSRVGAVEERLR